MLRDRPVTSFLVITFGVSYALGIPFNVAASSLLQPSGLAGIYVPRVVTVIGPAVAALLVARAGAGVMSAAQLFRSLRLQRRDIRWVASSAIVALLIGFVAFAVAGLPVETLLEGVTASAPSLLGHLVVQVTVIGVGEELGWRGWLLPTLSMNRSFLRATASTGLAWAIWHLPVFFAGFSMAVSFAVLVASLSIAFSWLWHRTGGSTGVVALAHGFVNAPFFFLEQLARPMPDGDALTVRAFGYFAASYGAVALALCVARGDLWRARGVTVQRT